ncbi:penicillin-binding protein 1C [Cupriavidus consociatus]|uniref:penicillin-binding protein 1C n=1 Tax=Cupriavidus consociatus TaxID=2821357 RepID=UPI001AE8CB93|nr:MULTISPECIES: penicillin-binding protein 1C [unclassified Cupriavidus]MBP0621911.1 penicillin-binding protein 1C [Cupriavidus sp. LEh25]MDK2658586.1 penicillin-binding protein 1C [Cupriavidus sp. LEh21]
MKARAVRLAWLALLPLLWSGHAAALPAFAQVRDDWRSADVVVLDRHGDVVGRVRDDFRARRGDWVTLAQTSPALRTAIVLSEDKRFYVHSGVDWQGVAAAAWANLWNTRTRGASTLTMQLAGLLGDDLRRPGAAAQGRSFTQKVGQAAGAAMLERSWSKDQILEAYLNLVPFRGELVGLSAMSQVLFGKYPEGLDARESALAVALVRAPNAPAVQVARRACGILREMRLPRQCEGLEGFAQLALLRTGPVAQRNAAALAPAQPLASLPAPHLARRLVSDARAQLAPDALMPARIVSTLDGRLQRMAAASLDRHLRELAGRHVEDGAVVVIDNASGDVLAYVGSSGELSSAAQVDHAAALRQAGSTLKPFLYAQALEERRLTAASLLDDRPVNLPVGGGLYVPQNYDHRYAGWVSTRAALAASLNVPAVRTLVMVTPHRFHKRLVALGLPLTEAGDYYGYSLALGSADVSLLALTNAYRALASGGRYAPPRLREGAAGVAPVAVMQPAASYVIGDILADRHARARTFGLDSPLTTRFWTAVKTGTSKDMRDNWCIGWSQRYTVGVWVGNASGAAMRDVSGVSGAAPVWHEVMEALHRAQGSRAPEMPAGVQRVAVDFDDGLEPAREEVFLAGTAITRVSVGKPAAAASTAPAIANPANGTVFALDPDMPPASQRVWFQAEGVAGQSARAVSWRMDGKTLGRGAEVAWLPWPGRHQVELLDAAGKVVDRIGIEVRGASVRAPSTPARR